MKKKKRFIVVGLVLLIASVVLFMQYNSTLNQAKEIARINEERAELYVEKAHMYQYASIVLGGGGIICFCIGLLKKRSGWDF